MPLYEFKCPHGHTFDHTCKMANRGDLIPCEGVVSNIVSDEEYEQYNASDAGLPDGWSWVEVESGRILTRDSPCILGAKIFVGNHNSPKSLLNHGSASNRDAAREGRYDPLNPNTRFMAKGREWRE